MSQDNTTHINAKEYDKEINRTVPFYNEFYHQTLTVVEQFGFKSMKWLDLGCGTGTMEELALEKYPNIEFVLLDPSEKMLEQAKQKLQDKSFKYLCKSSVDIDFKEEFDVVTAIQSHHYFQKEQRAIATKNVWSALKNNGVYICFENVVPVDNAMKEFELLRWGRYQQSQGRSELEAKLHNARCGVNYFPITVTQHIQLLKKTGFKTVYVFWRSYMQMGILAVK